LRFHGLSRSFWLCLSTSAVRQTMCWHEASTHSSLTNKDHAMSTTVINYIELPAADIAATKAFYAAAFGWDWIGYGPGYASHLGEGLEVALNGSGTVVPAHASGEQNGVGPLVLFGTDDLSAVHAEVLAAGGSIVSEPYNYPGGRRFHFGDPSGNVLGVYQSSAITDD
jgi:predicted enzyme related to lactoylglutathione lyase